MPKGEELYIKRQSQLKREIEIYQRDRDEYLAKQKEQESLLQKLASDERVYKRKFNAIISSKKHLQRELERLKIVKGESSDIIIKKGASSGKKGRRGRHRGARYRGKKSISPIENSKLIKRFGLYLDPVYKFKIFNKSITLKAPYRGAKVRSVLAGEIVFAEDSGKMLGKVVIIEHKNRIHTIYAKLSRFAPGIKVGKRVPKGAVIGKVRAVTNL